MTESNEGRKADRQRGRQAGRQEGMKEERKKSYLAFGPNFECPNMQRMTLCSSLTCVLISTIVWNYEGRQTMVAGTLKGKPCFGNFLNIM